MINWAESERERIKLEGTDKWEFFVSPWQEKISWNGEKQVFKWSQRKRICISWSQDSNLKNRVSFLFLFFWRASQNISIGKT